jgi:hypothetical protein
MVIAGLAAVFYLPIVLPVSPVDSESYLFGYNNRAGAALFILLLASLALYVKRSRLSLPLADRGSETKQGIAAISLVVALASSLLLCLLMWWFISPYGGFSESSYFIDRLQLLMQGKAIYRDFEFAYGPMLLYGPQWLCRAFHLSPGSGYYLFWCLDHLIGTALLWEVTSELQIAGEPIALRARSLVFLVLWLFQLWQISNAGVNYTPLRVVLPVFLVIRLHRLAGRDNSKRKLRAGGYVVFGAALLLAVSPEQAIAFSLAGLLYLPLCAWNEGRPFKLLASLMAITFAGLFLYCDNVGLFLTMRSFSLGGYNFPIFVNVHVLFIFAAVLLCTVYVATGEIRERVRLNSTWVIVYSCASLPAALGRCDPLHMLNNEIGIVACAFLIVWRWKSAWNRAMLVYVMFFLVAPLLLLPRYAGSLFGKAALGHIYAANGPKGTVAVLLDKELTRLAVRRFGVEQARIKLETLRSSVNPHMASGGRPFADATLVIEAPFLYLPNSMGSYQGAAVDTGFFSGTLNAVQPSQIQQKIGELKSHPERDLVVPSDTDLFCHKDGKGARKMLKLLFVTPVPLPMQHADDVVMPLCTFIRQSYTRFHAASPDTSGYELWRFNGKIH